MSVADYGDFGFFEKRLQQIFSQSKGSTETVTVERIKHAIRTRRLHGFCLLTCILFNNHLGIMQLGASCYRNIAWCSRGHISMLNVKMYSEITY